MHFTIVEQYKILNLKANRVKEVKIEVIIKDSSKEVKKEKTYFKAKDNYTKKFYCLWVLGVQI